MINALLLPLMKKYRKLILSMIAVSSLGIALMVGLSGAYDTLDRSLAAYVQNYRYADAVLTTEVTEKETADLLRAIPGVKQVNTRLVADTHVRTPAGRVASIRGLSYGIRDFQQFFVWDMNESTEYPNVALDFMFAKRNGIQAGDLMEVKLEEDYETVCVGSIISSAECLAIQSDAFSMGDNPDFGYLFAPEELLFDSDYYAQGDQFLLRFDEWTDGDAVLKEAEEILGEDLVNSFLYRDSGVSRRIEMNLQPLEKLSILLPVLFFINMVAVVSLFLSQIIRQSRRDIGILRALGFEKRDVRRLFSRITFVITLAASVLGFGIGVILMLVTSKAYGDFFPLPQLEMTLNPVICLLAVLITIAAGQLSSYFGTSMIASILPSEAMSREAPAGTTSSKAVRRLLDLASPGFKYCMTSLLRNRRRFLFSVLCVASSIMLILSAVAFNESKNGILTHLFDGRIHYGCQIFFREAPDEQQLAEITATAGVSQVQPLHYFRREVGLNGKTDTILLAGVEPGTALVTVFGTSEEPIAVPETGLVLELHTAKKLGAAVGDTVYFDGIPMTVAALSDQSINRISYFSLAQSAALGEADQYTILCNADNEDELLSAVSEMEGFSHADFTHLLREGLQQTFATYSIGVEVLIGFAVMLGVIIVYNTMQTNLLEQKKELSVLRAIGFQVSDISNMWLMQSGLQFLLSCAVGLPAGTLIAKYTLAQMATEGREYPFSGSLNQYIVTVVLVLAYILMSHYAAMGIIRKWDISENTKEKE